MNKISGKPYIPYIVAFLGAYGLRGTIALNSSENIRYSNSIFLFFAFCIMTYALVHMWDLFLSDTKKHLIWSGVFSILFSVCMHFGSRLESADNVRLDSLSMWMGILAMSIFMTPVISVLWQKLPALTSLMITDVTVNAGEHSEKPVKFLQIWGIIFLLWIPTFLALFPGAFVYDAQEEYIEVISRNFNMHHPLLHVLLLGGLVHGAEYIGMTANAGIAAYVIAQMIIMSAIMAYMIKKLETWGMKKVCLAIMIAFIGLFPVFPMYAVCTAKDGLFTSFLLLLVIELCQYVINAEDFNPTLFTVGAVIMMLMRNNGIYAFTVSMIIILCVEFVRNKGRLSSDNGKRVIKMLVLTLLSMLLYFGTTYVLKTATQAADDEHQEMLTVPIQQLARVYTYSKDVFTDKDSEILHDYLPEENLVTYTFRVSDVLKSGFNNPEYDRDPASFWSLWRRIGARKPLIYLNAWFGTSYGYWYPDALNNVYKGNQMYTFQYTDSSYFGFETEPPGVRQSMFPLLEKFYENISLHLFQQKMPLVSQLFSPGFMWWLCVFVLFYIFSRKKDSYRLIIPLMPAVFVWLTVLLGPTTLVRYVLILWFIVPVYFVLINEYRRHYEE